MSALAGTTIWTLTIGKGDGANKHTHPYPHTIDLLAGSLRVEIDGAFQDYAAPALGIAFAANVPHGYISNVDGTIVNAKHDCAAMAAAIASGKGITQVVA